MARQLDLLGKRKSSAKITDPLLMILGIAHNIQRKSQAIGSIARQRYTRESESFRYISHEIDVIYGACSRLIKELGK